MNIIKYINENNLDAILISSPKNIFYLTGFDSNPHERLFFLLITKENKYLLLPKLEEESARKIIKDTIIIPYLDSENAYEKLNSITGSFSKLGVEKENLSVLKYENIKNVFNVSSFTDISSLVIDMRKIKREDEIEKMKKAAFFADKCIEIAKNYLKVGISEIELKSIIENEIKKLGINSMSFETMVLFGENAANPHGISSNRKLKENEYILLDLGCYFEGYASDITRCLEFGKVDSFSKDIYNLVLKANMEAIKSIKIGMKFSEIDKIARDIISKAGFGNYFNHRLGHGLGIECHEFPSVAENNDETIKENMIFTIEPGIYIPNKIGIRIEDDILVTKNGAISLTKYEK